MSIQRVRFFDGQFLKEIDFRAEQDYHLQMRRRMNFLLFERSGVIQIRSEDLTLLRPKDATAADKTFYVAAGTAIGLRGVEGKEVVLEADSELLNLTAHGIKAGETAYVALHHQEVTSKEPPSEGDVDGDTRTLEKAVVTVHPAAPAGPADNGEPYIVLGAIAYDSMTVTYGNVRQVAKLRASLVAPEPGFSISPNVGQANSTVTVKVTASGGLDLSGVTNEQVLISPPEGITFVIGAKTQDSLMLTLTIGTTAPTTQRILRIKGAQQGFTVLPGMVLSSFDPVDEPNGSNDLFINGSGFTGTTASVTFANTTTPVTASVKGTTKIQIPTASIPASATAGTATVSNGTQVGTIELTPPAKVVRLPATGVPNQLLILPGIRFSIQVRQPDGTQWWAPLRISLIDGSNNEAAVWDTETLAAGKHTFPIGSESVSATEVKITLPANLEPGNYGVRVRNRGGIVRCVNDAASPPKDKVYIG